MICFKYSLHRWCWPTHDEGTCLVIRSVYFATPETVDRRRKRISHHYLCTQRLWRSYRSEPIVVNFFAGDERFILYQFYSRRPISKANAAITRARENRSKIISPSPCVRDIRAVSHRSRRVRIDCIFQWRARRILAVSSYQPNLTVFADVHVSLFARPTTTPVLRKTFVKRAWGAFSFPSPRFRRNPNTWNIPKTRKVRNVRHVYRDHYEHVAR